MDPPWTAVFGALGLVFALVCDGGVEPEENLALKFDIQEPLLPEVERGIVFWGVGDCPELLRSGVTVWFGAFSSDRTLV